MERFLAKMPSKADREVPDLIWFRVDAEPNAEKPGKLKLSFFHFDDPASEYAKFWVQDMLDAYLNNQEEYEDLRYTELRVQLKVKSWHLSDEYSSGLYQGLQTFLDANLPGLQSKVTIEGHIWRYPVDHPLAPGPSFICGADEQRRRGDKELRLDNADYYAFVCVDPLSLPKRKMVESFEED